MRTSTLRKTSCLINVGRLLNSLAFVLHEGMDDARTSASDIPVSATFVNFGAGDTEKKTNLERESRGEECGTKTSHVVPSG